MKIVEFVDSKQITIEELNKYFKEVRRVDINPPYLKGCYSCGDYNNQQQLPSEPWTGVQYCWKCNSLNMILYGDRMGGALNDIALIFQDK